MDNLKYLEHVVELGKVQAATTPEEMSGAFDAFNGFLGLYYDLAKMELQKAGIDTPPIRNFAIDKALERIDARLDCADFTIPALIRMLREHRGTRLNEEQAQKIEQSLIHFKYLAGRARRCARLLLHRESSNPVSQRRISGGADVS